MERHELRAAWEAVEALPPAPDAVREDDADLVHAATCLGALEPEAAEVVRKRLEAR